MSQEGLKMTHVTVAGCQRSGNWRRFSLSPPLENMGVEMTAATGLRFWTRATVTYLVFHLLHLHPLLQVQSVLKIIPKNKYQGAKNWPGENYNLIPQQKRATARWSGHWCSSSSSSSSPLSSSSAGSGRRHRSYYFSLPHMNDQEDHRSYHSVFYIYEWMFKKTTGGTESWDDALATNRTTTKDSQPGACWINLIHIQCIYIIILLLYRIFEDICIIYVIIYMYIIHISS